MPVSALAQAARVLLQRRVHQSLGAQSSPDLYSPPRSAAPIYRGARTPKGSWVKPRSVAKEPNPVRHSGPGRLSITETDEESLDLHIARGRTFAGDGHDA